MTFKLPSLKFAYNALEPYISADVIKLHYGEHTRKYFETANTLIKGTAYENKTLDEVVGKDTMLRMDSTLFNNVNQAWNHCFFFDSLTSHDNSGQPSKELLAAIEDKFETYDSYVEQFTTKASNFFGSGWCWVVLMNGTVQIRTTPNASNPLTTSDCVPLLVCDLWEHSWYTQYPANKAAYLKAFWNVVNWDVVSNRYTLATKN